MDPIVVASQIVMGLQTIVSRQLEVTKAASVITIGMIRGGVRPNTIPDEVEFVGTIRSLDGNMQEETHRRIRRTATMIAESAGATAEVTIDLGVPVTFNDPALTQQMVPTMQRVAGPARVLVTDALTAAEDFAYFANEVPSLYFFLGVTPETDDPATAAPNHSPLFFADEGALIVGVRAMAHLAADYMYQQQD